MDNVVAARRLRKSALRELGDIDLDIFDSKASRNINKIFEKNKDTDSYYENSEEDGKKLKISFKVKLLIKVFICSAIIFSCLLGKLVFLEQLKNNKMVLVVWNEYNKDYEKDKVLTSLENKTRNFKTNFSYAIPNEIADFIRDKYHVVKPHILDFNVKNEIKGLFTTEEKVTPQQENLDTTKNETKIESNAENSNDKTGGTKDTGVGGGGPLDESDSVENQAPKYQESISAISIMDVDVSQIIEKKISIIKPVTGTITSRYGAREQVFSDVDPYHTGIDIANKLNTSINSATTGKVTNIEQNNKYYGRMIEIETDGVIFKYGHLNETKVTKGQNVKQGDIIGLMGSTGMSTGSHLHFEIRINGRSVDPEQILKF